MHRASSTTRVSDEFFSAGTNSVAAAAAEAAAAISSPNPKPAMGVANANSDLDHLRTYNPLSHVAKKEKKRFRSAENAIHLIPLLLVLCAFILWFFSGPVDVVNESDSVVARVEGSLINKGVDSDRTKSSWEPESEQEEDLDAVNQSTDADHKTIR